MHYCWSKIATNTPAYWEATEDLLVNISKTRIVEALSVVGYFLLACLVIQFFSIGDYDWMQEQGVPYCVLPASSDDTSDVIASLIYQCSAPYCVSPRYLHQAIL